MENLRAFKVTTLQPTNSKPVRVKVQDLRFNKSVILNYTYKTADNEKDLVCEHLQSIGIPIVAQAWHENSDSQHQYSIYLTDNFTSQITL